MTESNRLRALQIILKPIVRFMLSGAHSIQDFIEVLKIVYVDVSKEQLEKEGQKVNASRLVMATGIHRIEVNRLLKEQTPNPKPESNMLFRIIGQWQFDKKYRDKDGNPRVLKYKGKNSEFSKLLHSISRCLIPGTTQFELERIGAIEVTPEGLKLVSDFQRLTGETPERFELIANDVESLLTCIQENLDRPKNERGPDEIGNLHLRTEYDNIFLRDIPEIRKWLMAEGKEFHKRAREYFAQFDKDIIDSDDEAGGRVMLHAFSLTSPNGQELTESEGSEMDDDSVSSG